ncbi:MAG: SGNH/GDSL hydrolase family protein [Tissierellia bacterium]|nr:SGNH/GDSL hydrolase family protein [Tissierellia bacterium]
MNSSKRILAYGDSYLTGYGVPVGKNFLALLEEKLPQVIMSRGENGATAEETWAQILRHPPREGDLVLLHFGLNDCLGPMPLEGIRARTQEILGEVEARGGRSLMILPTLPSMVGEEELSYIAAYISFENRLREFRSLTPGYDPQELFSSQDRYYMDGLHLNEEGHQLLAQWVHGILVEDFPEYV